MALPTKADLLLLGTSHLGRPFVDVEAKGLSTVRLDVSHLGRPFVGAPGSAAVTHATTGALVGAGTTLSGSAARTGSAVTHETTGALVGAGAVVAGAVARLRVMTTSGVLIGQGSSISGVAARSGNVLPATPTDTHDGFLPIRITSKPKRKKFERLYEDLIALYEQLSGEAVAEVPMLKPVVADYVKPAPVVALASAKAIPPPEIDWAALQRDMTRLYLLIEQNRQMIEEQDEEEAVMLLLT